MSKKTVASSTRVILINFRNIKYNKSQCITHHSQGWAVSLYSICVRLNQRDVPDVIALAGCTCPRPLLAKIWIRTESGMRSCPGVIFMICPWNFYTRMKISQTNEQLENKWSSHSAERPTATIWRFFQIISKTLFWLLMRGRVGLKLRLTDNDHKQ